MWLLNTLRKLTRGPDVGQTFRHYIGCYLLVEQREGHSPDYLAMPTDLAGVELALRPYLQALLAPSAPLPTQAVEDITALLQALPARLQQHVAGDMHQPLLQWPEHALYVRTGVRERRKENGKFVE